MSLVVPPEAVAAQRRSSDPALSVWVAANAGAGKTTVLSERVIRLLLAGASPRAILCLTFTNAAAAEMGARIAKRLGELTRLTDAELRERVAILAPDLPADVAMARARTLFAEALETPGGLKIQTLHAFAQSLLRRFPLEAAVSGSFTVLDDAAEAELSERAVADTLALATRSGRLGQNTRDALETLLPDVGDGGIHGAVRDMLRARDGVLAIGRLGLERGPLADAIAALEGTSVRIGPSEVSDQLLHTLLETYPSEKGAQPRIKAVLEAEPGEREAALQALVLTTKLTVRDKDMLLKSVSDAVPGARKVLEAEGERQLARIARRKAELTAALLALGVEAVGRYMQETKRRALIGYDDQIEKAAELVAAGGGAAWIRHKLDEGIDHLLLDEAQDTSSAQWKLVTALTGEFFAGEGARDVHRTLFVVGDEKQSIYSFQGAAPWLFDAMREQYRGEAKAAQNPFTAETLAHSFRSAPQVLSAVDAVFAGEGMREAIGASAPVQHRAVKTGPGGVDLWPLIGDAEDEADDDWTAPVDAAADSDGKIRLARALADTIKGWVEVEGPAGSPPVPAGDIMVLVRGRNAFSRELIASLKRLGVPSAGADRLRVTEHIAAKDMMALARALLSDDDLSLAAVLRSPLFNVSEEDLFTLCHERGGTLMDELRQGPPALGAMHTQLQAWRDLALSRRPFDFFCAVLSGAGQRERFVARMGAEAADVLDAFLDMVLAAEQQTIPTLESVLFRLERSSTELKRAVDASAGGVRVMTVHGAKGLEAPVVVLADIGQSSERRSTSTVTTVPGMGALEGLSVPVFAPRAALETDTVSSAKQQAKAGEAAEHLRLLYVAMTRAERHLVVCGAYGKTEPKDDMWHARVWAALEPSAEPAEFPTGAGLAWRSPAPGPWEHESAAPRVAEPPLILPKHLRRPAVVPAQSLLPWQPSSAAAASGSGEGGARPLPAAQYGTLVHDALDQAQTTSADTASIVAALAPSLSDSHQADIVTEVDRVLALPVLQQGTALTEVDMIGDVRWPDGIVRRVRGRIDRLQWDGDHVTVIDFKTDRNPPDTVAEASAYTEQLAAYRALIQGAHPQARISTKLIYTATGLVLSTDDHGPVLSPA